MSNNNEIPTAAKKQIINRNLQSLETEAYDLEVAIKINKGLDIEQERTEELIELLKTNQKKRDKYEELMEELGGGEGESNK
jgi:hypothetical protein